MQNFKQFCCVRVCAFLYVWLLAVECRRFCCFRCLHLRRLFIIFFAYFFFISFFFAAFSPSFLQCSFNPLEVHQTRFTQCSTWPCVCVCAMLSGFDIFYQYLFNWYLLSAPRRVKRNAQTNYSFFYISHVDFFLFRNFCILLGYAFFFLNKYSCPWTIFGSFLFSLERRKSF